MGCARPPLLPPALAAASFISSIQSLRDGTACTMNFILYPPFLRIPTVYYEYQTLQPVGESHYP